MPQGGGNGQPLVEGVRLVLQGALDVLERHGVTRIDATGEAVRPEPPRGDRAGARAPAPSPIRSCEQFQPGYALHDRLLRPAQVSVSAKRAG